MNALAVWAVPILLGQLGSGGEPESVGQQLAADIVRSGYTRVGVLPRFLVQGDGKEVLGGSVGPQGEVWPERLEEELVQTAGGRFKVIDGKHMETAFHDLIVADLGNPEALRKVAQRVGGMDVLVVGTVVDRRGSGNPEEQMDVRCRLIDLGDGSLAAAAHQPVSLTLSDAAYMGESWELRRWTPGGLINVGLEPGTGLASSPFGQGPFYEQQQYRLIRRNLPHPLSNPDCPYRIDVAVDGQPRPLVTIGNTLYVALDPGEQYEIRGYNRSPRDAYMAVFVDGINVLGKKRETPADCRYWFLKTGSNFALRGWTTGARGEYQESAFVITPADDSVALGQGFGQSLGLVTAVVYTVGMEGVPKAAEIHPMMTPGTFGTGAGAVRGLHLEEVSGPKPGLILAAMTIHYATNSQLNRLQKGSRSY